MFSLEAGSADLADGGDGNGAEAGDVEKATAAARTATRALDKAVSKGVIHANQAANRKSAIASKAASLS